jgi:hypothetical protein
LLLGANTMAAAMLYDVNEYLEVSHLTLQI